MTTVPSEERLGWIGVGKMGHPMAGRLLDAGHALALYDPVATNAADLAGRGAALCGSAAEVGTRARVVFATIPNDAALRQLVYERDVGLLAGMTQGSVLVEMSTVSPAVSAEVAGDLAARGILYLRAPISGSTELARGGKLTVLASGDAAAWTLAEPLTCAFSAHRFYLGLGEEARYMKLVLNTLVGATASLLGEALVLGERGGLSPAQMLAVIGQSAVASPLIAYKRLAIEAGDFTPAFSVEQMIKDFTLITEAGRTVGAPMEAANLILEQYRAAATAGHKQEDFFALLSWFRDLSEEHAALSGAQKHDLARA